MPSSYYPTFFPLHWRYTTVSESQAVEDGLKQLEDETEYRLLRQEISRVTWHAVDYETENRATVSQRVF